jgi:type IV pilus assembly protein PilM
MGLLKKPKKIIGLDIGKYAVKFVEFSFFNNTISLSNIGHSCFSFETIVDEMLINTNEIIERIKTLISYYKIKNNNAAVSIPGNDTIIKRIQVKGETYNDIKRAVELEAPNHIPYNINEIKMAFHVFDKENGSEVNDILLIAVKEEVLDDYISILIESGLKPEIADIDFFAIQNIFEYNYNEDIDASEIIALIDIGANLLNILILKNFQSIFYRDTILGNFLPYERIQNTLNISYAEVEKMKIEKSSNHHIQNFVSTINKNVTSNITKGLDLFLSSSNEDKIDKIFLSGGEALDSYVKEFLKSRYPNTEINYLDPFKKINIDENLFDRDYIDYIKPQYAVASGLALRGLDI